MKSFRGVPRWSCSSLSSTRKLRWPAPWAISVRPSGRIWPVVERKRCEEIIVKNERIRRSNTNIVEHRGMERTWKIWIENDWNAIEWKRMEWGRALSSMRMHILVFSLWPQFCGLATLRSFNRSLSYIEKNTMTRLRLCCFIDAASEYFPLTQNTSIGSIIGEQWFWIILLHTVNHEKN